MKKALLIHNPGAGDEEHNEEELIRLITSHGFECLYTSVKDKGWKDFDYDVDFLVVAGGDGTVRKVAKKLLQRKMIDKTWPIGLLPCGTANNIAKTLHFEDDTERLIKTWQNENIQQYDVGRIENLEKADLFLESLGYGIFPYLMMEMDKRPSPKDEMPEEKLTAALELLHNIAVSYEPHECSLTIDGVDYSGEFILLELMNTKSIGPNLFLAPDADPGDGLLEIVAVTENNKKKFVEYIANKLKGKEAPFDFSHFRGKNITIRWQGTHVHVDDEVIKIEKGQEIKVELKEGLLQFLVA
ncbi:MAG TPA: diacylglycerol kinase family protein [Chitinophagaceae bacterium]|nr:diacylglycerol kinase family protein [Chitinophagaceae bacterium]